MNLDNVKGPEKTYLESAEGSKLTDKLVKAHVSEANATDSLDAQTLGWALVIMWAMAASAATSRAISDDTVKRYKAVTSALVATLKTAFLKRSGLPDDTKPGDIPGFNVAKVRVSRSTAILLASSVTLDSILNATGYVVGEDGTLSVAKDANGKDVGAERGAARRLYDALPKRGGRKAGTTLSVGTTDTDTLGKAIAKRDKAMADASTIFGMVAEGQSVPDALAALSGPVVALATRDRDAVVGWLTTMLDTVSTDAVAEAVAEVVAEAAA